MANQRFEEIDVERINIREPDGTLRLTLASNARMPDPLLEGTDLDRIGTRGAGLMFVNDEGLECGGLVYSGKDGEASALLAFDRYHTDEVVKVAYGETDGGWEGGFVVQDRPATPLPLILAEQQRIDSLPAEEQEAATERLMEGHAFRIFVGRRGDGAAGVFLNDSKNRPRIRLSIDADDEPRLEFLDADGNVTLSLPPS